MTHPQKEKHESLEEFVARVPLNTLTEIPYDSVTNDEIARLKGTNLQRTIVSTQGDNAILGLEELQHLGDELIEARFGAISDTEILSLLRKLLASYDLYAVSRSAAQIWYRARKCEHKRPFTNLADLIYLQKGSSKYGRASMPRQRTMYGAWNRQVAMEEVNAEINDVVQIIWFRPRVGRQVDCIFVGAYEHFDVYGSAPQGIKESLTPILEEMRAADPDHYRRQVLIDSIIAKIFRLAVAEENSSHYRVSAIFASMAHANGLGVVYPSVKNLDGFNLATDASVFDSQFEVIKTEVFIVRAQSDQGVFQFFRGEELFATKFAADGTIYFRGDPDLEMTFNQMDGHREIAPKPGWRTPRFATFPWYVSTRWKSNRDVEIWRRFNGNGF